MTKELSRDLSRSIPPFSSVVAGQGLHIAILVWVPTCRRLNSCFTFSLLKQNKGKKRKHVGLLSYVCMYVLTYVAVNLIDVMRIYIFT